MKFLNEILDYNAQLRHFLSYLPFESILRLRSVLHIQLIEFEDCFVSSAILQPT